MAQSPGQMQENATSRQTQSAQTTRGQKERSCSTDKQQKDTIPDLRSNNISLTVCETTDAEEVINSADLLMSRTPDASTGGHRKLGNSPHISTAAAGDGEITPGQIPRSSSDADSGNLQRKTKRNSVCVYHKHAVRIGNGVKLVQTMCHRVIQFWLMLCSCLPMVMKVISETISTNCECVEDNTDGCGSTEMSKSSDRDRPQAGRGDGLAAISSAYSNSEEEETVFMLGTGVMTKSYYVKARLYNIEEPMVLDTGCSRSVIPTSRFQELPAGVRWQMTTMNQRAQLADGTTAQIRGSVTLQMTIGPGKIEQEFLIADLHNEILLGMDFFQKHGCIIDFTAYKLKIKHFEVSVCDKDGKALAVHVQNATNCMIPAMTEMMVKGRLNQEHSTAFGMVEAKHDIPGLLVAAVLCQPVNGEVHMRLWNTNPAPLFISSGKIIGLYQPGEDMSNKMADKAATTQTDGTKFYRLGADTEDDVTLPPHLKDLAEEWCKDLSHEETISARKLLWKYRNLFSTGPMDLGRTDLVKHAINLKPGAKPVKQRPYRHPPHLEAEIERQVQEMLEKGLISESYSAWSSPVILVRKGDNSYRMCIDLRTVNSLTEPDAYPLPRIDDSLDALGGNKYFSCIDMVSGYHQIGMDEKSKDITAFCTKTGLYHYNVMCFGLTAAPACFERLMERVMKGLHWRTLLLYLDDVVVFAPDFNTHLERLDEVFSRLESAHLKLKASKCTLFATKVRYLGHVINAEGVQTDPRKVESVQNWPTPRHKRDVRSFLGTTGYYRRFLKNYAELSKPLTQLTTKDAVFEWSDACQQAFDLLRQKLMEAPVLVYPSFEPDKPFVLDCDASDVGTGAVLSQVTDGVERVVAYFSKMLKPEEQNYCATRKEMLAIIKAVKHFRHYLLGRRFTIRTDHSSLIWILKSKTGQGQTARWLTTMSEYIYDMVHRPGVRHGNADGLSRQFCLECLQCKRHFPSDLDTHPPEKELENCRVVKTLARIAELQREDVDLKPVYHALQRNIKITEELAKQAGSTTKKLVALADQLSLLEDGTLVVRLPVRGRRRQLVVCPQTLKQEIVTERHGQAHLGFSKTLARVMVNFYWPGMTGDIRRHVASCQTCQQSKTTKTKSAGAKQHLYVGRPWQQLAVDLVGPLQETTRGNSWVLVLTDHFTRFSDAIAIPDATAATVATTLDERVFTYFGVPETIHTDQGSNFESELFHECCKLWGCKKTRTAPYTPTGNSVVERGNRVLGSSLRALLLQHEHEEWDQILASLTRALRATPHTITGETANYLMLGREVRLPESLTCPEVLSDETELHQYAEDLKRRMEVAHQHIVQQQQQTLRTEASEEPPLYLVGDRVWLKSFYKRKGKSQKLMPKYIGPYTIHEVLPHHTYRMERSGKYSIQHEGRIKLLQETTQVDQTTQPLQPSTHTSHHQTDTDSPTVSSNTTVTEEKESHLPEEDDRWRQLMAQKQNQSHRVVVDAQSRVLRSKKLTPDRPPISHSFVQIGPKPTQPKPEITIPTEDSSPTLITLQDDSDLTARTSPEVVKTEPVAPTLENREEEHPGTMDEERLMRKSGRATRAPQYLAANYWL